MRRLLRWAFNFAAAVSALVSLAAVLLWVQGAIRPLRIVRADRGSGRLVTVMVGDQHARGMEGTIHLRIDGGGFLRSARPGPGQSIRNVSDRPPWRYPGGWFSRDRIVIFQDTSGRPVRQAGAAGRRDLLLLAQHVVPARGGGARRGDLAVPAPVAAAP